MLTCLCSASFGACSDVIDAVSDALKSIYVDHRGDISLSFDGYQPCDGTLRVPLLHLCSACVAALMDADITATKEFLEDDGPTTVEHTVDLRFSPRGVTGVGGQLQFIYELSIDDWRSSDFNPEVVYGTRNYR
jgi:hypothetical protein